MCRLHLAGIVRESIVDGPGLRFVVFAQGCPHGCPGCHNPQTWPFEGGFTAAPQEVLEQVKKNPLLKGITLSGGEPFCQSGPFAALASLARAAGLQVVTYTGYLFEQLLAKAKDEPDVLALLQQTDLLVDGPFVQTLKSYELNFCGSSNQRILDVPLSLRAGKAVPAQL